MGMAHAAPSVLARTEAGGLGVLQPAQGLSALQGTLTTASWGLAVVSWALGECLLKRAGALFCR